MATRGWKFTAWRCGKCKCLNIHNCPKPEDTAGDRKYWDSTMICVWCNNCSFVAIWPSGRCRAKLLGGDGEIIETNAKPATLKTLRSRIEADYV
jgi:hypothetical protein